MNPTLWLLILLDFREQLHKAEIILNQNLAGLVDQALRISLFTNTSLPRSRSKAADPDAGPYCLLNSTTSSFVTSIYASSGFIVSSGDCRVSCEGRGCTQYRYNSPPPNPSYVLLSQCVAAESFHYSLAGTKREVWCPFYDYEKSVFNFKGRVYKAQWYWLGWGTKDDCMNAILCGPTSHYFDISQSASLVWCQPTPWGMFSPSCSNAVQPCTIPKFADDMRLAFWTSHGYGYADGCGVRLVASALITGVDIFALSTPQWTVAADIKLVGGIRTGAQSILFGAFLVFFISVAITGLGRLCVQFYHHAITVSRTDAMVISGDVDWYPGEKKRIIASLGRDGTLTIYVENSIVYRELAGLSTGSLGTVITQGLKGQLTANSIHLGPVFVEASDFVNMTTITNPYIGNDDIDFELSNFQLIAVPFVPTTTAPPRTTTAQSSTVCAVIETPTSTELLTSTTSEKSPTSLAANPPAPTTVIMNVPASSTGNRDILVSVLVICFATICGILLFLFYRRRRRLTRTRRDSETLILFPDPISFEGNEIFDSPTIFALNCSINSIPTVYNDRY